MPSPRPKSDPKAYLPKIGKRIRQGKIPQKPSPEAELERQEYELDALKSQVEKLRAETKRLQLQNLELSNIIELRKPFAWTFTWLSIVWLGIVLWIVYQVGIGRLILPTDVLQWLIAGVAVDLIGLLYIIARFLFPDPKAKS